MKQLVIALLKILGFYFLFVGLQTLLGNLYYISIEYSLYEGNSVIFIILLTVIVYLLFFYILTFKTEMILKPFKIHWEPTADVSYQTILQSGIFLIGFYFFLSAVPHVVGDVISWLKTELSNTNGDSVNALLSLISPFNPDAFINSLVLSAVGLFVALKHKKIANYFIKKNTEENNNNDN